MTYEVTVTTYDLEEDTQVLETQQFEELGTAKRHFDSVKYLKNVDNVKLTVVLESW
ncbi:hypothetical protein KDN24_07015 [Bacillus sp. Bva_UNVM-123]|uniref:hypothetical protein n=1 Tax=Bacillus sp. Bva_UNVM-123 TaxID=2829798 RepID=UPI00391FA4C8